MCEIAIPHRKPKNHRTHAHRKFQPKRVLYAHRNLRRCGQTSQVMLCALLLKQYFQQKTQRNLQITIITHVYANHIKFKVS